MLAQKAGTLVSGGQAHKAASGSLCVGYVLVALFPESKDPRTNVQ